MGSADSFEHAHASSNTSPDLIAFAFPGAHKRTDSPAHRPSYPRPNTFAHAGPNTPTYARALLRTYTASVPGTVASAVPVAELATVPGKRL